MKRVFLLILGVPEGLAIAVAAIVLQPADDRLFGQSVLADEIKRMPQSMVAFG